MWDTLNFLRNPCPKKAAQRFHIMLDALIRDMKLLRQLFAQNFSFGHMRIFLGCGQF
ncbi:MAG TPA: hypothetical protein H9700_06890 [Candidatus Eisenbergiella intestinipullorum]|nr:hypothetical protein [Candidatus Eisenbergiella intestinipullorum]